MAKLTTTDLTDLNNFDSAVTAINSNNALIETALENTLSRDGASPNMMNSVLDMNSNRIINVSVPVSGADAVNKTYVDSLLSTASASPDDLLEILGLENVDNTSDLNKPVSTATQTALDGKVDTTTTVNGHALSDNVEVTAEDLGLDNVNNTSDADKPVSTATQNALDDKLSIDDNLSDLDDAEEARDNLGVAGAITLEQYGADGDAAFNSTTGLWTGADCSLAFSQALSDSETARIPIVLQKSKKYLINSPISFNGDWVCIQGIEGNDPPAFVSNDTDEPILAIGLGRSLVDTLTLGANVQAGDKIINVGDTSDISEGMLLRLVSNKAWYNDPREDEDFEDGDALSISQGGTDNTITLISTTSTAASVIEGKSITILYGTAAGQTRVVTDYNETTKVCTVDRDWETNPVSGDVYCFPQLTKGQLTCVGRVVDSTTVEIEGSIDDGYHVVDTDDEGAAKEEVSVEVINPCSVVIKGVGFYLAPGDNETRGLALSNLLRGNIDVTVHNGRNAGCSVSNAYASEFNIRNVKGASDSETGYGTQISSSTNCVVSGRGWNNRRLIDISGTIPSLNTTVRDFYVSGGGLQEDDDGYWPDADDVFNYGVGSHGPASRTIYENGYIDNVKHGIYERGRGAVIRNIVFGPRVQYGIVHSFGGSIDISNCVTRPNLYDNLGGTATFTEVSPFTEAIANRYMEHLLFVGANLGARQGESPITVRNCNVQVSKSLVGIELKDSYTFTDLNIYDNEVRFYPTSTSDEVALLGKTSTSTSGSAIIQGVNFGPNLLRTANTNTLPDVFGTSISIGTGANHLIWLGPNTVTVRMVTNSAVTIPVPQTTRTRLHVELSVEEQDTAYFNGIVTKDSSTLLVFGGEGVEGFSSAPDGGSGTTYFGMHFGSEGLTLQNRVASTRTVNLHFKLLP